MILKRHIVSTRWVVLTAGLALAGAARAQATPAHTRDASTIEAAIAASVTERMGPDAEVTVDAIDGHPAALLHPAATADPGATLGVPIWFTVVGSSATGTPARRALRVRAVVHVTAPCSRASVEVERGQVLTAADVQIGREELTGVPLRALPAAAQLVGARTLQPLRRGELIRPGAVAMRRLVESGDSVTALASTGTIEVTAMLVAVDAGDRGAVIRAVNHDTRRSIRVRVISKGLVEVIHVP